MAWWLYIFLGIVLAPVAGLVVAIGCVFKPDWRHGVAARFGLAPRVTGRPIVIWCASVGEVTTARRLIRDVLAAGKAPVVLAVYTPSGLALAKDLFAGQVAAISLVPLDILPAVEVWLGRLNPRAVVLFETEMWPVFIRSARRRDIPIAMVNGRLSDRSLPRYRLARFVLAPALAQLNLVLAQTAEFAARLITLGAPPDRTHVTGSLKFDLEPPRAPAVESRELYERFAAGRRLLVVGSTHAGEERLAAEVWLRLRETIPDLAMIVAPRHVKRGDEALAELEAAGCRVVRRSRVTVETCATAEVLLLDVLGELSWVYGLGAVAFVGGSFAAAGGHNVLEPASVGVPVTVGPRTPNFLLEVETLREAGGLRQVENSDELTDVIRAWMLDEPLRRQAAEAARQAAERHRGATTRTLAALESYLS